MTAQCTCGYGGFHEPEKADCDLNRFGSSARDDLASAQARVEHFLAGWDPTHADGRPIYTIGGPPYLQLLASDLRVLVDASRPRMSDDTAQAALDRLHGLIAGPDEQYRPDLLEALADLRAAIEASRPRVVTTAAELDELSVRTVLVDAVGHVYRIAKFPVAGRSYMQLSAYRFELAALRLPATVVWSPPATTDGDQR